MLRMVDAAIEEKLVFKFVNDHSQQNLEHFGRNKETLTFLGHLSAQPGHKDVSHHDAAVELLEKLT